VTGAFEIRHHLLGGFCRNGEADADRSAGHRVDRSGDADYLAIEIETGSAGIALIDRRIDL